MADEVLDPSPEATMSDTCLICLEVLGKPVVKLPCEHAFCSACMEQWRSKYDAASTRTCPHCRAPLPPTRAMVGQLQANRDFVRRLQDLLSLEVISVDEFCAPGGTTYSMGDIPDIAKGLVGNERDPDQQQHLMRTWLSIKLEKHKEITESLERCRGYFKRRRGGRSGGSAQRNW